MNIGKLVNFVLASIGLREARPERMQVFPSTEDPAPYEAEAEPNPKIVSKPPPKASEIKDCTGHYNIAESSVGSFSTRAAENISNPASIILPWIK
jgi:hypothetical protein